MKNNIALIGFMCAGKSTAGKALAAKLGMPFIEMDSLIEKRAGKSIPAIFSMDGESAFRRIESEIVTEVSQMEGAVISCGGGVVLDTANIRNLRTCAVTVYLRTSPDIILERYRQSGEIRPLLNTEDPSGIITGLLRFRQPLYEQAGDIIIDTSGASIDDVVNDIMAELDKHASLDFKK